jgi:hypothetical protein
VIVSRAMSARLSRPVAVLVSILVGCTPPAPPPPPVVAIAPAALPATAAASSVPKPVDLPLVEQARQVEGCELMTSTLGGSCPAQRLIGESRPLAKEEEVGLVRLLHGADMRVRFVAAFRLLTGGKAYRTDHDLAVGVLEAAIAETDDTVGDPLGWTAARIDGEALGLNDAMLAAATKSASATLRREMMREWLTRGGRNAFVRELCEVLLKSLGGDDPAAAWEATDLIDQRCPGTADAILDTVGGRAQRGVVLRTSDTRALHQVARKATRDQTKRIDAIARASVGRGERPAASEEMLTLVLRCNQPGARAFVEKLARGNTPEAESARRVLDKGLDPLD